VSYALLLIEIQGNALWVKSGEASDPKLRAPASAIIAGNSIDPFDNLRVVLSPSKEDRGDT
jgi:hypothetical protein